ncbi:MAG: hypothetical protein AB7F76_04860 [Parvibaculaceae bacterium]
MSWNGILSIYLWLVEWQRDLNGAISAALRGVAESGSIPPALIGLGLLLGSLHAMTPGHGKSIILSYFLGRNARYRDGAAMGMKIAASHTLSAVLLVLFFGGAVTLLGRPSGAAEKLQTISYALIAVIGAYYMFRAIFREHGAEASSPQSHSHLLPVAVGVLPCPLTMLVVGSAMAQGATLAGLMLAGIMGTGAAATIVLVGLLSIGVRRAAIGWVDAADSWVARGLYYLEIASSAIILAIGASFFLTRL